MARGSEQYTKELYRQADRRAPSKALSPLRALMPFLAPYRGMIVAAGFALVAAAAAALVLPAAVRGVIDHGFSAEDAANIGRYFLALIAVAGFMGVASATRFYLVSWIGERVVADVRTKVFSHVLSLSPSFFETVRIGEVLSRLTADTTLVQTVVGSSASVALRNLVLAMGSFVLMVVTSPKLAALCLVGVPLTVAPIILFGRRVRRLSRTSQDRVADMSAYAGEALNAVLTVQAFTHENLDREKFQRSAEGSFAAAIQRNRMRAALTAFIISFVGFGIVVVLWIGASDVLAGRMTGGELSQFILYAVFLASGMGAISETWGDVQRASGATERLMEILSTEPTVKAPDNPVPLPRPAKGAIRFDNVGFRYPSRPEHRALADVSFAIAPGEAVALVGPSGAGKSTVFHLLLRFFDPQEGRILFDGIDIASADPRDVRRNIALVAQDPVIFAGTIEENIRYGRPEASAEDVRAAAMAAAADEFIRRLPEGYESLLGERGVTLSGGQRQRLAIARAILRDAPLLLLDEATSALDAENERLVQQGLANLMSGRTTIVIAHRLATIQRLKRIVVMDQGVIIGEGSHAELVARGGLYARLASLQFDEAKALAS
ncbi:MAG: ATP-binding cassette domain-containing protein [Alphaproteobacteria bacterium]|nr:ATP-binding cassette domain-containing protein [Alphaproteobacteria bacterium]